MAYKFVTSEGFWFPVDIRSIDDNGTPLTCRIKARFKRLPTEEIEKFQSAGFDPVLYADCVERANGQRDLAIILLSAEMQTRGETAKTSEDRADELLKIVMDWDAVETQDEDGKRTKLEFSRDNLVMLLRHERTAYADFKDAYNRAVSGEGRKGN